MFIGSSDSPMWKRGWRSFSSISTFQPRRASRVAAVLPAGPPPMTRMSVSMACAPGGAVAPASTWSGVGAISIMNTPSYRRANQPA